LGTEKRKKEGNGRTNGLILQKSKGKGTKSKKEQRAREEQKKSKARARGLNNLNNVLGLGPGLYIYTSFLKTPKTPQQPRKADNIKRVPWPWSSKEVQSRRAFNLNLQSYPKG
jgi:hypothetical protein